MSNEPNSPIYLGIINPKTKMLWEEVWNNLPGDFTQDIIEKRKLHYVLDTHPNWENIPGRDSYHGLYVFESAGTKAILLNVEGLSEQNAKHVIAHELIHAYFEDRNGEGGFEREDYDDMADSIANEFGFPPEDDFFYEIS